MAAALRKKERNDGKRVCVDVLVAFITFLLLVAKTMRDYCCYLLESRGPCPGRLYKGCTNNLGRRLRQHNGELVGGAKATARPECRPWQAVCVVSNLTRQEALRLEWRWKHPGGRRSRVRGPLAKHMAHLRSSLDRLGLAGLAQVEEIGAQGRD